jgi:hypothetical protein
MASCHRDAIPCVLKNEGKKLYQMFHTMFSMTNLHQASLPTIRAEFYAITQKEGESILKYTSRVDVIVATMAKLGERISPGPGFMRSEMASGPNSGNAKTAYYIPKMVSAQSCRSRRNCSVRKQLLQVRQREHLPCHSPSRPSMTKLLSFPRQRKTLKNSRYHQQPRLTLLETRPLPLTPHYG